MGTIRELILDAARPKLVSEGDAGLSTRKVAEGAEVHLSQLHYHFGGKQQLLLGVLECESARLLERQAQMYGQERPLAERYEQACDFLDEDLASGYVRLLQEMTAAAWSDAEIAGAVPVHRDPGGHPARPAVPGRGVGVAPRPQSDQVPIRDALRRVAGLIQQTETGDPANRDRGLT